MKIKLTLMMSLMTLVIYAQNNYSSYSQELTNPDNQIFNILYESYYYDQNWPLKNINEQKFNEIEITLYDKKGRKKEYKKEYNLDGKLTRLSSSYNSKDYHSFYEFNYNDKKELIEKKRFKKDKLLNSIKYSYNDEGKLLKIQSFNHKNSLNYQSTSSYNNLGCIDKYSWMRSNNKIISYTIFEYYEKCDRKKTTRYNSNGKVKNIISYACKNEGEILEKRKNEKQMCQWDEVTKDFLIKINQTFDEKGRKTRVVLKYDIKDSTLLERTNYNFKNEPTYSFIYEKTYSSEKSRFFPRNIATIKYKNGQEIESWKKKYENNLLILSEMQEKGKLKKITSYEYDDGKLILEKSYKKDKLFYEKQQKFKNDLLVETKEFGKNNKLIKHYKIEYKKPIDIK